MTGTQIEVFHERCMGAGNCAEVAPGYFDQSDADGTVVLRRDSFDPADREVVDRAIEICPVAALGYADKAPGH
ncbi:ferredoxin [Saccharopolyspora spinosa]|nr:ferredoxin [Saccharopolyspora spinosa]